MKIGMRANRPLSLRMNSMDKQFKCEDSFGSYASSGPATWLA